MRPFQRWRYAPEPDAPEPPWPPSSYQPDPPMPNGAMSGTADERYDPTGAPPIAITASDGAES